MWLEHPCIFPDIFSLILNACRQFVSCNNLRTNMTNRPLFFCTYKLCNFFLICNFHASIGRIINKFKSRFFNLCFVGIIFTCRDSRFIKIFIELVNRFFRFLNWFFLFISFNFHLTLFFGAGISSFLNWLRTPLDSRIMAIFT